MLLPIVLGGGALVALGYWLGKRSESKSEPTTQSPPAAQPPAGQPPSTQPPSDLQPFMPSKQEVAEAYAMAATQPPEMIQWVIVWRTWVGPSGDGPIEGEIVLVMPYPSATAVPSAKALLQALEANGTRGIDIRVKQCPFTPTQLTAVLFGDTSIFEGGFCTDVWHGWIFPPP